MPVSKRTTEQKVTTELTPYWRSECGRATVYVGDCREVMSRMEPEQFHAVVTDPPYGLEFMGKEWDAPWKSVEASRSPASEMGDPVKAKYLRHNVEYNRDSAAFQQWFFERAEAMLRIAKPGAHLVSFGGTRMWHRMACAAEDAGWEIRDTVMWVYGSGFPKSHDVSKAIDKMYGTDRTEVLGPGLAQLAQGQFNARDVGAGGYGYKAEYDVTAPATDDACRWQGWGTALKPSHEPIILARRPPPGTVAQCVLENGTGALNIDGCRVGTTGTDVTRQIQDGRWPANLIHDGSEEVVSLFPEQKSSATMSTLPKTPGDVVAGSHGPRGTDKTLRGFNDEGSAARFFYTAKADNDDRQHGRAKGDIVHPTVKPLDLMRYLVRLVCARGGTVLDPFMGSGSTGCACVAEGMYFVGIEQSKEYADIAVDRLKEHLGVHEIVERLSTGKRAVKTDAPPPELLR